MILPLVALLAFSGPKPDTAFKLALSATDSLYVESCGAGRPVVMVPGLLGSAYGFRRLAPLIVEAGYRAVVIEPLGIGFSSRPEGADYSMGAQADRIAEAIRALDLHDVLYIGHSIGGSIGFRLAVQHPDVLSGLLTIEGGPAESLTTASFRRAMRFAPLLRVVGGMPLLRRTVRNGLQDASGDRSWVTDAVVAGYIAGPAQNLKVAYRALGDMAKARESGPVAPHLTEVKVPVRLMVGNAPHHAGQVDPNELVLLGRNVHAFALDTVAGAGHFIHEEQPATVVAAMERLLGMEAAGR